MGAPHHVKHMRPGGGWSLFADGDLVFDLGQELITNARHLLEVIDAFERAVLLTLGNNGLRLHCSNAF